MKNKFQVYSDYAYFGKINGKIILVKERPNIKSFIDFDADIFLFHNVRDKKEKYTQNDFKTNKNDEKTTLEKIKDLKDEKRKLLFNKYFEQNPIKNENDLRKIRKIYTLRYRIKEHI